MPSGLQGRRGGGEFLLDELTIPGTADHTGVDTADAHAQFSRVAVSHFTSLCVDKPRALDANVFVQLSLGQRMRFSLLLAPTFQIS